MTDCGSPKARQSFLVPSQDSRTRFVERADVRGRAILRTSLPPSRIVPRLSPTAYLRIYPVTALRTTGSSHRGSTTETLSSERSTRELHLDGQTNFNFIFLPTHPRRIRHTQATGGSPLAFPFKLTWPSPEPELCSEFAPRRPGRLFSIAYLWGYVRGLTDLINRLCN